MLARYRWLVAIVVSAAVFAVVVWLDAVVVKNAKPFVPTPDFFGSDFSRSPDGVHLFALGSGVVGGAAILYAGIAWWVCSRVVSLIFLVGGALELIAGPAMYKPNVPFDGIYYINSTLASWLSATTGPLNAAQIMGGALVVAGAIGIYRWAVTRQLALKDA